MVALVMLTSTLSNLQAFSQTQSYSSSTNSLVFYGHGWALIIAGVQTGSNDEISGRRDCGRASASVTQHMPRLALLRLDLLGLRLLALNLPGLSSPRFDLPRPESPRLLGSLC